MLKRLIIENFALIDHLDIPLEDGLSIITGETGAGKSIILGALSLILGNRADAQSINDKSRKCIVEGHFHIKDYDLEQFFKDNELDYDINTIIRREINSQGKSRAFINDTPVNLNTIKQIIEKLIDIHSQHETLLLNENHFQINVIDSFAGHLNLVKQYQNQYKKYIQLKSELETLNNEQIKAKAEEDYQQFLYKELEEAQLKPEEQDELESESEILNHTEEIKSGLNRISYVLNQNEINIILQLNEIQQIINKIKTFKPSLDNIAQRMAAVVIEIKDLAREIEMEEEQITFSPERVEFVNQRLDIIYHLQQKHRVKTIEELISIQQQLEEKLGNIISLDDKINILQQQLQELTKSLMQMARQISDNRKATTTPIKSAIEKVLQQLGLPHAQIAVAHQTTPEFNEHGIDQMQILFSANVGSALQEISKVASGGELSRLMLAIKSLVSQKNLLPTIIFDEIDTGVSGETANKVGQILQHIAKNMQVIVITHLPQIAGKGKQHFYVYKQSDGKVTQTFIKKLNEQERIMEIAKMLSGNNISESAIQTAKELLTKN